MSVESTTAPKPGKILLSILIAFVLGLVLTPGAAFAQPTDVPDLPGDLPEIPPEEPPAEPGDTPDVDPGTPPEFWAIFDGISTRALIDNENYVDPGSTANFGIINTSVIIGGDSGTQTVVWRGRGPSLNLADGVPKASDPVVEVVQVGVGLIVANENYLEDDNFQIIEGTGKVPGGIQENEGIATTPDLAPGAFTVRVKSDGDTRGVAQGEAFAFFENDTTPEIEPGVQLSAISTRAPVGQGTQESMNTNFIVVGPGAISVVCRGRGPSINLPESITKLPDPFIELVQIGVGVIASNDSYETADNLDLITGTTLIPDGIQATEAIIVQLNLEPGAYTVRLRDSGTGEGIGISEALVADL